MTVDEARAILGTIKAAYPKTFGDMKRQDADNMVNLWAKMFDADPIKHVAAAVEAFISTDIKGFPPAIGMIKDHIRKLTTAPEKSAMEAWGEVMRALKNSGYNSVDEFGKLDAATKRVVGSPSTLREWALDESGRVDTVIASNFRESYNACVKNFKEQQMLPPSVLDMVNLLSTKMDLNPTPEKQDEPKPLPISIPATLEEIRRITIENFNTPTPERVRDEDFEKRREELLKWIMETPCNA